MSKYEKINYFNDQNDENKLNDFCIKLKALKQICADPLEDEGS